MKLKQKLLLALVASILATPAFAADSDVAGQTVDVTVPMVKLLDMKNATGSSTSDDDGSTATDKLTITLAVPTTAGANFANVSNSTGVYDITANVDSAATKTRSIGVTATGIKAGWLLNATSATGVGTVGTGASLTALNQATSQAFVTGITNVAKANTGITYTFGPIDATTPPAYTGAAGATADVITLTYTLSDAST